MTLCKQLAAEWAPHGITVNSVAPTFIRTEQVGKMLTDPAFYAGLVARIPAWQRLADLQEVMSAVLFLVSPAANFITGHISPLMKSLL